MRLVDSSSLACVNPSLHGKKVLNLVNPNIRRARVQTTFLLEVFPKRINMLNMLSLRDATTTGPAKCLLGLFHRMSDVAPCWQRTPV